MKPTIKEKQKKSLTHRDDFLMVVAFVGAGALQWFARTHADWAVVAEPLSYVLVAIGAVILFGIVQTASKKKPGQR